MSPDKCKICDGTRLATFAHTAKCLYCGVLLYWPYPEADGVEISQNTAAWSRDNVLDWYSRSSFLNHVNFTNMIRFAMDDTHKKKRVNVLDYGGGGGQFALVCRSHFPQATVFITDISDSSLLDEYKPLNTQIPFREFASDKTRFDVIFLNDVFEHVSDPIKVLRQLAGKLAPNGRIFIDTPKQFWIYPATKLVSTSLHTKVLSGTVSLAHLQIWSKKAFLLAAEKAGLAVVRYEELSEYTMPPSFYLNNMGIRNPLLRTAGMAFYGLAEHIAKNKISCILTARK
jgi:2-polyprenyl-3-methyl-5-hydroxy-6-metoxy-1,4-benzoquinol methylase